MPPKPVRDDVIGIWATLKDLATETEKTAQQFHRDKSHLDDEGRYYLCCRMTPSVTAQGGRVQTAGTVKGCLAELARRREAGLPRYVRRRDVWRWAVAFGCGVIRLFDRSAAVSRTAGSSNGICHVRQNVVICFAHPTSGPACPYCLIGDVRGQPGFSRCPAQ